MERSEDGFPAHADVAVVGGGVIGLAVAWRLAERGADVALLDPHPGRGASWAAAGMLAPVAEVHYGEEALLDLTLASSRAWPGFAAELTEASGRDLGYRACGTLLVARDLDDRAALDDVFAFQSKLGLDVQRLRSREARALEPGLAPGTRGGILVSGDHQVDNRALAAALIAACARAGVRLVAARAAALERAGERVRGVTLDGGASLACATVVLAAGCHSAQLGGLEPGSVPVRPVKGQLLHLRARDGRPPASRTIRGLDVYVVPRTDGRVVVGATVEEQGFDTTVTAGAVRALLRDAFELLPELDEHELVETVAGLRPGTPDNGPLLGPGGLDGLVLATGHYRNGILLTPATADAVAEQVATGHVPDVIAPFTPARFTDGAR